MVKTQKALPTTAFHKQALRKYRQPEPSNLSQLVQQMEKDYQFKLGRLVLTSVIESIPVEIHGAVESRAERLCDNLMTVWKEALPDALQAIAYGRAAFEKTFRIDPESNLALVAGLDYLPFDHTELSLDSQGAFAGIAISSENSTTLLEPERSWWFALDPTTTSPHGQSRYLGAAQRVFEDRQRLEALEEVWYSRFAIGHGVARAPEADQRPATYDQADVGEITSDGELLDPMEVMRDQCAQIESGGMLILSSQRYPDGSYLYDYQPTQGQIESRPLENRRRQLDDAALRSLGIPERSVTQDQATGSYSMASVHHHVLLNTCEGILTQLIASFQKYVIRKAVELNWPSDRLPTLTMTYRSATLSGEDGSRSSGTGLSLRSIK